jgi:hypothetical protein
MLKNKIIFVLTLTFFLCAPLWADEPFSLKLKVFLTAGFDDDVYYEPAQNIIRVRDYVPKNFRVEIKNVSSETQSLYFDTMDQGLGQIIFEATDENGKENVITKRTDFTRSGTEEYRYFAPGQMKVIPIVLNEKEWNNLGRLAKEGAKKIRIRAIFKSRSRTVYSEYYTIIMEI